MHKVSQSYDKNLPLKMSLGKKRKLATVSMDLMKYIKINFNLHLVKVLTDDHSLTRMIIVIFPKYPMMDAVCLVYITFIEIIISNKGHFHTGSHLKILIQLTFMNFLKNITLRNFKYLCEVYIHHKHKMSIFLAHNVKHFIGQNII